MIINKSKTEKNTAAKVREKSERRSQQAKILNTISKLSGLMKLAKNCVSQRSMTKYISKTASVMNLESREQRLLIKMSICHRHTRVC